MSGVWQDMQKRLDELAEAGLLRHERVMESACGPRVRMDGRELVCLCANDYLGLADHPAIKAVAIAAIEEWGVGAGASRLVSGTTSLHRQLEDRLAAFKRTPAALVTSTGWMANHAAIHALAGEGDLILCDKLNHASILDAAISSGARVRTYNHGCAQRARQLLERHRAEHGRCLIVTDSVFSMDGDLAPLCELAELKQEFDAHLLIDEAHATGVLGAGGRGLAEHLGVEEHVDATVGTLSKAFGVLGGFVAGPQVLIDTLRNAGRPYVYTTSLPTALCAAAMLALDIIETQPETRLHLLAMASQLRQDLQSAGLDTAQSQSQIIPVILGSPQRALAVSRALAEAGFLIPAIRPPTVPPNTSRLRISLSAMHEDDDVQALVGALKTAIERV